MLAAAKLLGATREVEPPPLETLSAHCLTVMQAEASAQHLQWMRERSQDYSSAVRVRLEMGYPIPAAQYLEALRLRTSHLEQFVSTTLAEADAYLCPTIAVPIPTREQTGPAGGPDMPKRLKVPLVRNREAPPHFVIENIFGFLQKWKLALQRPQAFGDRRIHRP